MIYPLLKKRLHLVLKTHVTLPPCTLSVVAVRITNPEVVHFDQYIMSNVDLLFKAQYPDVAAIPLMHYTMDKNPQDLAVCLVNPSEWEVLVPKGKTVQQVQPLTGQVHINRITVEQNEMTSIDTIITPKGGNAETCIIIPGDYIPHQEYELEDAEVAPPTRKKLDELIKKYDYCIKGYE